ncbi:hypothetical protein [Delftia sp. HK171]|uniref:hypothetical protein n=1 Tax=Delftia sp. HK171 TaxID=1920191 RepID=UPI00114E86F4|nr:hypothetical protein [Delftia sp. HK171]
MTEPFDHADTNAIRLRLRSYEERCTLLLRAIGDNKTVTARVEQIRDQYIALKRDLKADAAATRRAGKDPACAVAAFFSPAVNEAVLHLKPTSGSHPIAGNWLSAVYDARVDICHYLAQLDRN